MAKFSEEDMLNFISKYGLDKKNNRRVIVDKKIYLANILYNAFGYSQVRLASVFGFSNHASISMHLKQYDDLKSQKSFLLNTDEVRNKFPSDGVVSKNARPIKIRVDEILTEEEFNKLQTLKNFYGLQNSGKLVKHLINVMI